MVRESKARRKQPDKVVMPRPKGLNEEVANSLGGGGFTQGGQDAGGDE